MRVPLLLPFLLLLSLFLLLPSPSLFVHSLLPRNATDYTVRSLSLRTFLRPIRTTVYRDCICIAKRIAQLESTRVHDVPIITDLLSEIYAITWSVSLLDIS